MVEKHSCLSLVLCVMFCRSLFVLLYFFFWSLQCLPFFELRILIIPLVSLDSSCPPFFVFLSVLKITVSDYTFSIFRPFSYWWFILYSKMTFFFRFANKRASYPFGIISLADAPVNVTDFSIGSINCVRHFSQA